MEFYKKQVFHSVHYLQKQRAKEMGEEVLWCLWLAAETCRSCISKVPADTFTFTINTLKHKPYDDKIGISEDKIILPNCTAHYLSVVICNLLSVPFILLSKHYLWTSWSTLSKSSGEHKAENSYMTWAHLLATSKETQLYCGRELKKKLLKDKTPG